MTPTKTVLTSAYFIDSSSMARQIISREREPAKLRNERLN